MLFPGLKQIGYKPAYVCVGLPPLDVLRARFASFPDLYVYSCLYCIPI